ncbi:hypothetical protein STEG23_017050 [Scotinomys teguina]
MLVRLPKRPPIYQQLEVTDEYPGFQGNKELWVCNVSLTTDDIKKTYSQSKFQKQQSEMADNTGRPAGKLLQFSGEAQCHKA